MLTPQFIVYDPPTFYIFEFTMMNRKKNKTKQNTVHVHACMLAFVLLYHLPLSIVSIHMHGHIWDTECSDNVW